MSRIKPKTTNYLKIEQGHPILSKNSLSPSVILILETFSTLKISALPSLKKAAPDIGHSSFHLNLSAIQILVVEKKIRHFVKLLGILLGGPNGVLPPDPA